LRNEKDILAAIMLPLVRSVADNKILVLFAACETVLVKIDRAIH
jgi:hypothetical protein